MLTSLRNTLVALLLCCAAAASWYFALPETETESQAAARGTGELGYYLKGAVFRGMNSEGRLVYEISAARIDEHPSAEYLSLENVEISYFDAEEVPWLARAAHATAPTNREFVDLHGSVRLSSRDQSSEQHTVIETEAMRLEPERYIATIDGPVRFAVGGNWLTASRLEADLKRDVIRGSDVYGEVAR